jgi:hypothetical protein
MSFITLAQGDLERNLRFIIEITIPVVDNGNIGHIIGLNVLI